MDKTFIAVLAIALAVSAGVAFASPGWRGPDMGMPGNGDANWTWNGTGNFTGPGAFMRDGSGIGCRGQNNSNVTCQFAGNESFGGPREFMRGSINETGNETRGFGRGMRAMNGDFNSTGRQFANAEFNSTAMEEFHSAILSGDYATASSLNSEYGFGGPIFEKLNETTFAAYSQIAVLSNQLREELGINSIAPGLHMGLGPEGFGGMMPPPEPEDSQ